MSEVRVKSWISAFFRISSTENDFYREDNVPGMPLWIVSFFHIMKELQINIPTPEINNYNMIETTVERMSSDLIY